MDPGYKLLQHIKTVPNLINEDPSITTPKNSSFMDLPWSDFSKLLSDKQIQRRSSDTSVNSSASNSSDESPENFSLGNWDSMTGYQDTEHRPTL
ncbi:hypothetical protein BD560DRAFT_405429 [Blakeslea trispora]|nr:hypothetical protein BD560DRAFT_405429 [Blakeslea trispora]